MRVKQTITTCLCFDGCAEEAVNFYVSVFSNSKILRTVRPEHGAASKHSVKSVVFELGGQQMIAINDRAGAHCARDASFFISCEDQDDVDALWDKLISNGGKPLQSGWLRDKFGVSWRIIPSVLEDMIHFGHAEKMHRAMNAAWDAEKVDIMRVIAAYDGE